MELWNVFLALTSPHRKSIEKSENEIQFLSKQEILDDLIDYGPSIYLDQFRYKKTIPFQELFFIIINYMEQIYVKIHIWYLCLPFLEADSR